MSNHAIRVGGGILPRFDPQLLPDRYAVRAVNVKATSGHLDAYGGLSTITQATKTDPISIFRLGDYWLNWTDDVDARRGPIAGDTSQRVYFTGDGEPRVTNLALASAGGDYPTNFFVLGVPRPVTAPTVGVTGGSGTQETRAYVYTFVDPWNQEGQPSDPTSYTGYENSTSWDLSGMDTAPLSAGNVSAVSSSAGVTTFTVAAGDSKFLRVGEEVTFASIDASLNATFTLTEITSTTIKATTGSTFSSGSVSGTWSRVAPFVSGTWKQRIYRTDSTGAFRFVAEQNAGATFTDTVTNANLSGTTLLSADYRMPETGLRGLVELPYGSFAAFDAGTGDVYLSEPNKPWAWPQAYRQTVPFTVVGLGVYGSTVVVVTTGIPYIISGAHPSTAQPDKGSDEAYPCAHKRTIVETPAGVMWDTDRGLALIGPAGAVIATEAVFTQDEWSDFRPTFAALHNGRYYGFNANAGFHFRREGGSDEFYTISTQAIEAWTDPANGKMYLVVDGDIVQWDADETNPLTYEWLSKVYTAPGVVGWRWAKVYADYSTIAAASNGAAEQAADAALNASLLAGSSGYPLKQGVLGGQIDDAMVNDVMVNGSMAVEGPYSDYRSRFVELRVYCDGVLIFTKNLMDYRPFRLPFDVREKSDLFQIQLTGNVRCMPVELADTARGFAQG